MDAALDGAGFKRPRSITEEVTGYVTEDLQAVRADCVCGLGTLKIDSIESVTGIPGRGAVPLTGNQDYRNSWLRTRRLECKKAQHYHVGRSRSKRSAVNDDLSIFFPKSKLSCNCQ